jgi:hypothetical protein
MFNLKKLDLEHLDYSMFLFFPAAYIPNNQDGNIRRQAFA